MYFRFGCMTGKRISIVYKIIQRLKSTDINIVKSKVPNVIIPNQLIYEYVWQDVTKWYDKIAVVSFETGKFYTYSELHRKSLYLAKNLCKRYQLKPGDTVAVVLPNVPDFPIVFLGSLQAGLVVTTINPSYTTDEVIAQLIDSESKLVVTISDLLKTIVKAAKVMKKTLPIIVAETKAEECISCNYTRLNDLCDGDILGSLPETRNCDNVALLPYSSGTTGLPKGVQLTHRNVVSNLYQMSSPYFRIHLETEDNFQEVIPVFLPIFHIYGMVGVFLNYISKGCQLILISNFIATQFIRLLDVHKPTLLFAVPSVFAIILNNPRIKYENLKSLRGAVSAAAPLGISCVEKCSEKFKEKIDILQIYGMTETSPLTIMQTSKIPNGTKIGGSGFLVPNTECKVVSIDSECDRGLGPYKTGELLIRGPQVMIGYHNNAESTNISMNGDWLKTGDVCYYDDDRHFFITDRLKEMIKVKGFQVAPAELEEILKKHSSVEDAAVVGVSHPVQGEAPKAFVVLRDNSSVKPEDLKEYVASKVASYKKLVGGVVILKEIPRNKSGKILKNELRQM